MPPWHADDSGGQPMTFDAHRRVLPLALAAALGITGIAPALPAEAARPISVAAREVHVSVGAQRTVELPVRATHVALHWRGEHDAAVDVSFSSDGVTYAPADRVQHDEVGEQRGDGETYGAVMVASGATS